MTISERRIEEMLNIDPLADIDFVVGGYPLGLGFAILHNQTKTAVLESVGDSTHSNKVDRYLEIIESIGFRQALVVPFKGIPYGTATEIEERQFYYVSEDGILLIFDTYGGDSVNGGNFYYSWKNAPGYMENEGRNTSVLSSGQWCAPNGWPEEHNKLPDDAFWIGSHDCREAIVHHVTRLRKYGSMIHPWPKLERRDHTRHVWCCHHVDLKDPRAGNQWSTYEHHTAEYEQAIRNAQDRLKQLPQWALDILGPELHHLY